MRRARWLQVALLWAVTAGLLFALYQSGRTSVHRYEDMAGWGLNQERYIGENLANEVKGGERYLYVGVRHVFDQDPGPRIFAAAVILPIAVLLTIRLVRPRPAAASPQAPPADPPDGPAPPAA